jgi:hypothetical protein
MCGLGGSMSNSAVSAVNGQVSAPAGSLTVFQN